MKFLERVIPYDARFLGASRKVPLPSVREPFTASVGDGEPPLPYVHFTIFTSARRRTPLYAAYNVDGARAVRVCPEARGWMPDERLEQTLTADELVDLEAYEPLVTPQSVVWGSVDEARAAYVATFSRTNAVPKVSSSRCEPWAALEDWALWDAPDEAYRLSVLSGPFVHEIDRSGAVDARMAERWKIIVARRRTREQALVARAFLLLPAPASAGAGEPLGHVTCHVSVAEVERLTCLDFLDLKEVDALRRVSGGADAWKPVKEREDILVRDHADRSEANPGL